MVTITVLHRDAPGAPARIAATAAEATAHGFQNVETSYEPATGTHVVRATEPADQ